MIYRSFLVAHKERERERERERDREALIKDISQLIFDITSFPFFKRYPRIEDHSLMGTMENQVISQHYQYLKMTLWLAINQGGNTKLLDLEPNQQLLEQRSPKR